MTRPTLTIKTPVENHEVVLKTYLTGSERRDINRVYLENVEIETSVIAGATPTAKGVKGSIIEKAEDAMLTAVIVSIDGKTENIVDTALAMPDKDYVFLIAAINKITADAAFEKKSQV